MKFSCATQLFQKYGLEAAIRVIAEAGFDSIDLWSSPGRAMHLDPQLGREHVGKIRQQVETHGLSVRSLTAYGVHSPQEGLSLLIQYLNAARQVGARFLITGTSVKKGAMDAKEFAAYLRPAIHKATDEGVVLAIENHVGGFLETPEDCIDIAERFGSQYFGVAFAGHHFHSAGIDPQAALEALRGLTRVFYGWDKARHIGMGEYQSAAPEEQIPGQGQLDFTAALNYLAREELDVQPLVYWRGSEGWELERLAGAVRSAREYLAGCLSG